MNLTFIARSYPVFFNAPSRVVDGLPRSQRMEFFLRQPSAKQVQKMQEAVSELPCVMSENLSEKATRELEGLRVEHRALKALYEMYKNET